MMMLDEDDDDDDDYDEDDGGTSWRLMMADRDCSWLSPFLFCFALVTAEDDCFWLSSFLFVLLKKGRARALRAASLLFL